MTDVPINLLERAVETFHLSKALGISDDQAVRDALASALVAHEDEVTHGIADKIQAVSSALNTVWSGDHLADLVRTWGAAEGTFNDYNPTDGDIAEILVTGKVTRALGPTQSWWEFHTVDRQMLVYDLRNDDPTVRIRLLHRTLPK